MQTYICGTYIYIYKGFLQWGYLRIHCFQYSNSLLTWMIWGTPILGNLHTCVFIYIYIYIYISSFGDHKT